MSNNDKEPCIGCVRGGVENPRKSARRGNCVACYRALKRAIAAGDLTDQRAIELELWLPAAVGRPPEAGMHAAIDAALDAALDGSRANDPA